MDLERWLKSKALLKVEVTAESLSALLGLVERDLHDASAQEVSLDRRYAMAYEAALNSASYLIRLQGYRVAARRGHHEVTFKIAAVILGMGGDEFFKFFDRSRRKRNLVVYSATNVVTEEEVRELLGNARKFRDLVLARGVSKS